MMEPCFLEDIFNVTDERGRGGGKNRGLALIIEKRETLLITVGK